MSTRETGLVTPRSPRGSRVPAAALPSRHREYLAALATAAVLAQLLVAQLTLAAAVLLALTGRITRWRPHFLAVPAGAGLAWMLAAGPRSAAADYLSVPRRLAGFVTGPGGRHGSLTSVFARLPGQLPLALIAGAAEAGALLWLSRAGRGPAASWRPGLIASIRYRSAARLLAAGRTVTARGCAIGIEVSTGRRAELSWAQAERAVLICGAQDTSLFEICLPAVCAALRRRKAVLIADLTGGSLLARQARQLAASLGLTIGPLASPDGPSHGLPGLTAAAGQLFRRRGSAIAPPAPVSVTALTGVLTGLRDLGLRADALAWIHGCEHADPGALADLIRAGRDAGTGLLLSTASVQAAAGLGSVVEAVIAAGPIGRALAMQLASAVADPMTAPPSGVPRPAPRDPAVQPDQGLAATFPPEAPGHQAAARALESQPAGSFAVLARGRAGPQPGCTPVPLRAVTP
jgi:hypothetical protein